MIIHVQQKYGSVVDTVGSVLTKIPLLSKVQVIHLPPAFSFLLEVYAFVSRHILPHPRPTTHYFNGSYKLRLQGTHTRYLYLLARNLASIFCLSYPNSQSAIRNYDVNFKSLLVQWANSKVHLLNSLPPCLYSFSF